MCVGLTEPISMIYLLCYFKVFLTPLPQSYRFDDDCSLHSSFLAIFNKFLFLVRLFCSSYHLLYSHHRYYHTHSASPLLLQTHFLPSDDVDCSYYTATLLFTNILLLLCAVGIIRSRYVQCRIDHLRNGLDFRAKLLLDSVQIETILVGD